jgi:hypothetical protein
MPIKKSAPKVTMVRCTKKTCTHRTPIFSDAIFKPAYCVKCGSPLQRQARQNPLTRMETGRIKAEAKVHESLGRTAAKKAYYRGMAEGMKDIAAEFGTNPPLTKIYDRILEVYAQKGPGHKCDAACKRANHIYRHKFTGKHAIYGTHDGNMLIVK